MESRDQLAEVRNEAMLWPIEVADQEGDTANVIANENAPLSRLLHEGLDALYGPPGHNADDFDLVIAGVAVDNLGESLIEWLRHHLEVVITPKDVHRG